MDINYRLNIFLMLLPLSNNWLLKKCVVIQRIIFDILTLTSNKKVMMWVAVWGFAVLIMRWISPVFSLFLTPLYTSLLPLPPHLLFPIWTPFHLLFPFSAPPSWAFTSFICYPSGPSLLLASFSTLSVSYPPILSPSTFYPFSSLYPTCLPNISTLLNHWSTKEYELSIGSISQTCFGWRKCPT